MTWQPIKQTPPPRHLLFFGSTRHDHGIVFTGWRAVNGKFYSDDGDLAKPTHWMLLPEPPSEGRELSQSDTVRETDIHHLRQALAAIDGLAPDEAVFSYSQDQLRCLVFMMRCLARVASEGRE